MIASQRIRFFLYLAAASYYALVAWSNQFVLSEEIMFLATDAKEYREVSSWILGNNSTIYTQTRPVLYPALIALPYALGGVYGVWFLQFAAWLLSLDLIFSACVRWTKNYWISSLAVIGIVSNISVIALTFHGLTEIATILGLSWIVWLVARFKENYADIRFGNYLMLILVVLTLVKPVFYYPFLLSFFCYAIFYFKQYRGQLKKMIVPLIALGMLILQMSLVKVRHGDFKVSTISHKTFVEYLFTKGYSEIENIEFDSAQKTVLAMQGNEQRSYFQSHLSEFWNLFNRNIEENMKGEPVYLNFTSTKKRVLIDSYQYKLYAYLKRPHLWFLVLLSFMITFSLMSRRWNSLIPLVLIGGLLHYYIFATGLSFWQGDRLTLPIVALWPALYVCMTYTLITGARELYKKRFRK